MKVHFCVDLCGDDVFENLFFPLKCGRAFLPSMNTGCWHSVFYQYPERMCVKLSGSLLQMTVPPDEGSNLKISEINRDLMIWKNDIWVCRPVPLRESIPVRLSSGQEFPLFLSLLLPISYIHLKMAYQRFLIIFCVTSMVKVVHFKYRVLSSNSIREGFEQPFGLSTTYYSIYHVYIPY